MQALTRQQLVLLVLLTITWGVNWPVMKLGVTGFPPLTFRAISMWLGLPVLALGLLVLKVPFRLPRKHWRELLWLAATSASSTPNGRPASCVSSCHRSSTTPSAAALTPIQPRRDSAVENSSAPITAEKIGMV